MRVVLDARKLGDGGIGVYLENLIEGLCSIDFSGHTNRLELNLLVHPKELIAGNSHRELDMLSDWAGKYLDRLRVFEEHSGKYSLAEYFKLANNQRRLLEQADLFHSPHYTLPFALGIPSVVTIHDVIHVTHPDTFLHRPLGMRMLKSAANRASQIITVSHASLARINKVLGAHGAPVTVIPNAIRAGLSDLSADAAIEVRTRIAGSRKYVLFVGSDRPHKNFIELLKGWKIVTDRFASEGQESPLLIAVGTRFGGLTQRTLAELSLTDCVRLCGDLSTPDLGALYVGAESVVVPSLEEGFGLVALEAMSVGVPLLSTPEASLRELCGNSAWYSDGFDGEAFADSFSAMFSQPELRAIKTEDGRERARGYTRETVARQTLEVYEEALGKKGYFFHSEDSSTSDNPLGRAVYSQHLRRAGGR